MCLCYAALKIISLAAVFTYSPDGIFCGIHYRRFAVHVLLVDHVV